MKRSPDQATRRRTARLVAVQALHTSLHELELKSRSNSSATSGDSHLKHSLTGPDLGEFAYHWFAQKDPENNTTYARPDNDLFERLTRGALLSAPELAAELERRLAPKWKLERLEITLQAVLLVGAWEIRAARAAQNTDLLHIALKDYVELADSFFTGGESSLVNAVLDRVWTDIPVQESVDVASSGPKIAPEDTPEANPPETSTRRGKPLADQARVKLTTSHLQEIDERRMKTLRATVRSQRAEQQDIQSQDDAQTQDMLEPEAPTQDTFEPEAPTQDILEPEAPTQDILDPEAPTQDILEPEVSTQDILEPEAPTQDILEPEAPTQDTFEPEAPTQDALDPEQEVPKQENSEDEPSTSI